MYENFTYFAASFGLQTFQPNPIDINYNKELNITAFRVVNFS